MLNLQRRNYPCIFHLYKRKESWQWSNYKNVDPGITKKLKTFLLSTQRPVHSGGESLVKYNTLKLTMESNYQWRFWTNKLKQNHLVEFCPLCSPVQCPQQINIVLSWTWDLTGNQGRPFELTSVEDCHCLVYCGLSLISLWSWRWLLLQLPPLETRITSMHYHAQYMGG